MASIRKPVTNYDTIRESLDAVRGLPSIKKPTEVVLTKDKQQKASTVKRNEPQTARQGPTSTRRSLPPAPTSQSALKVDITPDARSTPAIPETPAKSKIMMHLRLGPPKPGQFAAFDEMAKTIPVEKLMRRLLSRAITALETSVSKGAKVHEGTFDQDAPSVKTTRMVSAQFHERMKSILDPYDVETASGLANRIAMTAFAHQMADK